MSAWVHTPHSPVKLRGIPWPHCRRCGLLFLRNELTAWCIRNGCDHDEHPSYRATVKRLGTARVQGGQT